MTNEEYQMLVNNLRTQDNQCTQNPLYVVQERIVDVGYDPDYSGDSILWVDTTSGDYTLFKTVEEAAQVLVDEGDKTAEEAREIVECGDIEENGFKATGYKIRWEFVSAHLTMAAARRYIAENSHHCRDRCTLELDGTKREMRVYVDSANRCHELVAIIEALKLGELGLFPAAYEAGFRDAEKDKK